MLDALSGATRIHFIVGDPIAQVKSPFGMTQAFEAHGRDAICIPAHVHPDQLASWFQGVSAMQNLDGLIITVPHKFAAFHHCASTTDRAAFVGAANTLRRLPDGSWHGDMCDGLGYVQALIEQGADPKDRQVPMPFWWRAHATSRFTTPMSSAATRSLTGSRPWPLTAFRQALRRSKGTTS
jgi:shikimate dehydrogenase